MELKSKGMKRIVYHITLLIVIFCRCAALAANTEDEFGCVGNLESECIPEITNVDRLKGMVKLAMYGDALGASTEGLTLGPIVEDLLPVRDFYSGLGSAWFVWLPSEKIPYGVKGIVTDDSAHFLFVTTRYMDWLDKNNITHSDWRFARFLVEEEGLYATGEYPYPIADERFIFNVHQHIADWIGMFDQILCIEAGNDEYCFTDEDWKPGLLPKANFYQKDNATCFGLFMFLPFAAWLSNSSIEEQYGFFRGLTSLDQGHAKIVTAIVGTLISQALAERHGPEESFSQWFQDMLNRLVQYEHSNYSTADSEALNRISLSIEVLRQAIIDNSGNSFDSLRRNFELARRDDLPRGVQGLKHDPAEFLAVINAALIHGEDDLRKSFRLINNSGGDTDTILFVFGLIAGAFWGQGTLEEILDWRMSQEMAEVQVTIENLLGVRLENISQLFSRTS